MTALSHHLTIDCFREAYYALKRDAAPGVDGETWLDYGQDLEERLRALHDRVKWLHFNGQFDKRELSNEVRSRQ